VGGSALRSTTLKWISSEGECAIWAIDNTINDKYLEKVKNEVGRQGYREGYLNCL